VLFITAVGARLLKDPRLEMLTGLIWGFWSTCMGSGTDSALLASESPSLIEVVAAGASCARLTPRSRPSSAPNAAAAGLVVCLELSRSACARPSSA
jgi:LytS/YehU family sensor histidine kinase